VKERGREKDGKNNMKAWKFLSEQKFSIKYHLLRIKGLKYTPTHF
jgi:hypothetical protein